MKTYQSMVALLTASTFIFSGCATEGETKHTQFSVTGCATGGAGAGLTTFFANLDDKDAKKKAFIAGMLGCMAGAVIGYQVGKRTEKYANAKQAAESEIARNNEETKKLRQYNAQVTQNIDDYNKQINAIQDLSDKEKTEDLKSTKKIVTEQRIKAADALKSVEADLEIANNLFDTYQAQATPLDREKWEAEIADYEEEKRILSESVRTLTALDSSI